jgi:hypothetical protein
MPLTTFEDYTTHTDPPPGSGLVHDILSSATYAHPVKSVFIEIELGIKGNKVRACIHYLRCVGYPIGSSSKGYWWAQTPEELATTIIHGEQRARSNLSWVRGLVRAAEAMNDRELLLDLYEQGSLDESK